MCAARGNGPVLSRLSPSSLSLFFVRVCISEYTAGGTVGVCPQQTHKHADSGGGDGDGGAGGVQQQACHANCTLASADSSTERDCLSSGNQARSNCYSDPFIVRSVKPN